MSRQPERPIVPIELRDHDYVLIPCEVLEGVRNTFGHIIGPGWPGHYSIYEYVPGGTLLEPVGCLEPEDELVPPEGNWQQVIDAIFPTIADARGWLEDEREDEPGVFWCGYSSISDEDMPEVVRAAVHGGKA
jgi:hypothetical protein